MLCMRKLRAEWVWEILATIHFKIFFYLPLPCLITWSLKYKNSYFTCFVWVWNIVSKSGRTTLVDGVRERSTEENICTSERGGWRKLHDKDIYHLYFWSNIVRIIKPRNMRWAGHAAWLGKWEIKNVDV
jgi:hypothetical protein